VLQEREHAPIPCSSAVFTSNSPLSLSNSLGACHFSILISIFFFYNILYVFSFPFFNFPIFSLFHNVPYNHDELISKKNCCCEVFTIDEEFFEGFPELTKSQFNQLCDGETSCSSAIAASTLFLSIPSYVFTSTFMCPLLAIV